MTPLALALSVLASLGIAGAAVALLRRQLTNTESPVPHDRDSLSLTFQTTTAKAKQGWASFWARDPFVQA